MMDGVAVRAPRADEAAAVTDLASACSIDDVDAYAKEHG